MKNVLAVGLLICSASIQALALNNELPFEARFNFYDAYHKMASPTWLPTPRESVIASPRESLAYKSEVADSYIVVIVPRDIENCIPYLFYLPSGNYRVRKTDTGDVIVELCRR